MAQSFLAEDDKKTNILNLNLIAVLVDYHPRSFNKFAKEGSEESNSELKLGVEKLLDDSEEFGSKKKPEGYSIKNSLKIPVAKSESRKKKAAKEQ